MTRVHPLTCTVIGAMFALTDFLVVHSAFAGPPVGRFVDIVPIPGSDLNLPGVVDGAVNVSRDGMTLFFVSNRAGGEGNIDIYQATRDSLEEPFGNVVNLGPPINTPFLEQEPAISADGLTLYFRREDATGGGSSDIYQATRTGTDAQFGNVMKLEGGINSEFADDSPAISSDDLTFYFTSTRPGGLGGRDIYQATRTDFNKPFGNVTRLGSAINTYHGEFGPNLSSDGKTLFIWSDRPGGKDNFPTIWVSTRKMTDEPFGAPVLLNDFSLGSDLDSPTAWEASPSISSDWPDIGAKLYFARITGPGQVGMYQATWVPEPSADFNDDGDLDHNDVDALVGAIAAGTNNLSFDLSADGVVNKTDLIRWLSDAATKNGFNAPYLFGDANLDGSVDATDLNALALNWRKNEDVALWSAGDFTADGNVNAADLNDLALNWRRSIPFAASPETVPEPTTFTLLFAIMATSVLRWRRRFSTGNGTCPF